MPINILYRSELDPIFARLKSDTPAQWGKMSAQHMVEHLAKTVGMTNGKIEAQLKNPEDKAKLAKQALIYTEMEMQQGIKSSLMGDEPDSLKYASIPQALEILYEEIEAFRKYFENEPEKLCMHPRLGPLNYQEWIIFHGKHFTHHFKQFGIL